MSNDWTVVVSPTATQCRASSSNPVVDFAVLSIVPFCRVSWHRSSVESVGRVCLQGCNSLDLRVLKLRYFAPADPFHRFPFLPLSKRSAASVSTAVPLFRQSHSNPALGFRVPNLTDFPNVRLSERCFFGCSSLSAVIFEPGSRLSCIDGTAFERC
jgi:hypothetical protein